jgi:hypothetical protein
MEPEKITRAEIEQARVLCMACIEAREAMTDCLIKLMDKLAATRLDADLLGDWVKFLQVGKFMAQKESLLDKRQKEVLEKMRAMVEAGRIPLLSVEDLTGEHCA